MEGKHCAKLYEEETRSSENKGGGIFAKMSVTPNALSCGLAPLHLVGYNVVYTCKYQYLTPRALPH